MCDSNFECILLNIFNTYLVDNDKKKILQILKDTTNIDIDYNEYINNNYDINKYFSDYIKNKDNYLNITILLAVCYESINKLDPSIKEIIGLNGTIFYSTYTEYIACIACLYGIEEVIEVLVQSFNISIVDIFDKINKTALKKNINYNFEQLLESLFLTNTDYLQSIRENNKDKLFLKKLLCYDGLTNEEKKILILGITSDLIDKYKLYYVLFKNNDDIKINFDSEYIKILRYKHNDKLTLSLFKILRNLNGVHINYQFTFLITTLISCKNPDIAKFIMENEKSEVLKKYIINTIFNYSQFNETTERDLFIFILNNYFVYLKKIKSSVVNIFKNDAIELIDLILDNDNINLDYSFNNNICFCYACMANNTDAMDKLMKKHALQHNNEVINFALEQSFNLLVDEYNFNICYKAANFGKLNFDDNFLNFKLEKITYAPFILACLGGSKEAIEYMLEIDNSIDLNSNRDAGIILATLRDYDYLVEYLLNLENFKISKNLIKKLYNNYGKKSPNVKLLLKEKYKYLN